MSLRDSLKRLGDRPPQLITPVRNYCQPLTSMRPQTPWTSCNQHHTGIGGGGEPGPGWDHVVAGGTECRTLHSPGIDIGKFLFQAMNVGAGQTDLSSALQEKRLLSQGSKPKYLRGRADDPSEPSQAGTMPLVLWVHFSIRNRGCPASNCL